MEKLNNSDPNFQLYYIVEMDRVIKKFFKNILKTVYKLLQLWYNNHIINYGYTKYMGLKGIDRAYKTK